jgi:hypothetical protein
LLGARRQGSVYTFTKATNPTAHPARFPHHSEQSRKRLGDDAAGYSYPLRLGMVALDWRSPIRRDR